jgi:hypothetical protein
MDLLDTKCLSRKMEFVSMIEIPIKEVETR